MKLNTFNNITTRPDSTAPMSVLFLGHGSPMNAIEENEFVTGWRDMGQTIPKPAAILCISAHWETRGTFVTAMEKPMTIHDFGGFPKALFDVQYPAPGSTKLAKETQQLIHQTEVGMDEKWGLDHGAWSVIKHLYPEADVPVVEMSLNYFRSPKEHYDLAKELAPLRRKGVLIIGSGNMVHNLRRIAWDKLDESFGFDWALEANEKMKQYILDDNHQQLINVRSQGSAFRLAIPTPEHYLPLLYVLALKEQNEQVTLFNDQTMAGSLSMTSVKIDKT
ncbi:dioxygenase [Prolixibacter bellariivorans]|uniref:Dioxygenase n=1 Tax=Prolixibacter bellariivorans TaxID=314319 RepID=A0A5M4B4H2_9BACT|nr:4,5-DOPA dioxygenase extradiol [Prolixibacter bellariivorans]GET34980.1 dioxygenase [Prolixibacter bellariivorans]